MAVLAVTEPCKQEAQKIMAALRKLGLAMPLVIKKVFTSVSELLRLKWVHLQFAGKPLHMHHGGLSGGGSLLCWQSQIH